MDCLQLCLIDAYVRGVVYLQWFWLMENFNLLQADLDSEELNSFCKAESNGLEGCFLMGKEGSIDGEEKLLNLLPCFGADLEFSQIELASICAVLNVDTVHCHGFQWSVGASC